jgi:hypothetical protein
MRCWWLASGPLAVWLVACMPSLEDVAREPTDAGPDAPGACTVGKADCDGSKANGCEVDLSSHPGNCGACGKACPPAPNAKPACVAASCGLSCDAYTGDCDGDATNGCEAPVEKDPANCGACGNVCGSANADSSTCAQGQCLIECAAGFGDCDGIDANGCEQALSDAEHCGECGRDCKGGACSAGVCQPVTLATGLNNPSALAVTSGLVYVATNHQDCSSGTTCSTVRELRSVPKTGGAPTTVLGKSGDIYDLDVGDSETLYFASSGDLYSLHQGQTSPAKLGDADAKVAAADSTSVYFPSNGRLSRLSVTGGAASDLVQNGVRDWNVALQGASVIFVGSANGDTIFSVPKAGGTPALVVAAGKVWGMAVDTQNVYWTDGSSAGSVKMAPLAGGSSTTVATGLPRPENVAADGGNVYWWQRDAGELMRAASAGGAAVKLYDRGKGTSAVLAVEGDHVYFVEADSKTLFRIAK